MKSRLIEETLLVEGVEQVAILLNNPLDAFSEGGSVIVVSSLERQDRKSVV